MYKKNRLTDIEKFEDTFGPKNKRIKPKLLVDNIADLANKANKQIEEYNEEKDSNLLSKKIE